jgi:hypothetical protein
MQTVERVPLSATDENQGALRISFWSARDAWWWASRGFGGVRLDVGAL